MLIREMVSPYFPLRGAVLSPTLLCSADLVCRLPAIVIVRF